MKKPDYVHAFRTRHGKLYLRFRREGFKSVPLPVAPYDSPEFEIAYRAAMTGQASPIGAARTMPGTFNALIVAFYNSAAFKSWAAETQRTRRNILERFRAENGDKRVAHLLRGHVDKMVAAKAATPAAARNFKKTLGALMQFAIAEGGCANDPTAGVKLPKIKGDGYSTWGEHHIAAFESRHAVGTRARLALALLLYTAQRRGDVVRMGRQHVRNGVIQVRQNKTGASLEIPVHPELQIVIEATPNDNLTFLVTEFGKPFSAAGFGNLFREWCNEAGLPKGYTAHGLRKAACRRLAEAGCTEKQIAAISGHASLSEVQRYTKAADQARLARSAMATVSASFPATATGTQIGKPK